MAARKPQTGAPRLDALRLPDLVEADPDSLEAHDGYDGLRFRGSDLDGRDLAGTSFAECEFVDVSAHDSNWRAARIVETRFERLDAAVLSAPRSTFRDVVIEHSRLGSAEFYEAGWNSVHLIGCKLGYLNLRGGVLQDVLFTDCTVDELDLGGVTATRVGFENTAIETLDATRATLKDVDLRRLELRRITGIEGLKGATMNSSQVADLAAVFAAQLGIVVED